MDVLVKSHAAVARVAAGIDAMLELRQRHKFSTDDIASMALGIPKIIQGRLTNPHPVDLQAAQMCLPFSVALASKISLSPGSIATIGIADFEAGLKNQSLHALEERTAIALDDEVEAASNELSTGARVTVTLRDGRTLSKFVAVPKGSPSQPFTGEEHESRFTQELSSRLSELVCSEIVAMSRNLDQLDPNWLGCALSGAFV
jgi:2-methylcitrate dehydratase PrpD